MTEYLRPIAAYIASQGGRSARHGDHHGQSAQAQPTTPDSNADTTTGGADTEADRGWTR